ncbi:MAG TPA: hypothetical protein VGH44_00220 [Candidatus Saccharimonadia bacterium]|jgi:hypothetical protein
MAARLSLTARLMNLVIPTGPQVFVSLVLSAIIICFAQSQSLLEHFGITSAAIALSQNEFHSRFDVLLRSDIASHIALVTFWAIVGLVAYLICWAVYNMLIEARNEVTLTTTYTNRGHWRGPYQTLALKAVASVGLAIALSLLWRGASFWITLFSQAITTPSIVTSCWALVSILVFAFQLYAVFVFVLLTFTPWYHAEAFTDV